MAQAQHAAIDTVQSSEGGGVLLGDVGAGEEERVSVSQVGERGPGTQVNRGLAVPGHCPVSTGIQHQTSLLTPTYRNGKISQKYFKKKQDSRC